MKTVKILLAAAMLSGAVAASAADYNRVGISYNNTHYGYNKDAGKDGTFSTNGFGIFYDHGFGLSAVHPMYLEVGANVNFNFYSETTEKKHYKYTDYFQNINLQVPVNFVWDFNVVDDLNIAPYIGLNFRFNFVDKAKSDWEDTEDHEKEKGDWISYHSTDEKTGVEKDEKWNVFQLGWQVGVRFTYSKFSLGVQYGTDFIPAYSHTFKEEDGTYKPRISTGNLKLSLGYSF